MHLHQAHLETSDHPGLLWNLIKSFGLFQRLPGLVLNAEKEINETCMELGQCIGKQIIFFHMLLESKDEIQYCLYCVHQGQWEF